jgi:hypothetical protein
MSNALVEFKLRSGSTVTLLVSESIPIAYHQGSEGNFLSHPTHNNGGYPLHKTETYEAFLEKMKKALETNLV